MVVKRLADLRDFLAGARPLLLEDEASHNLMLGSPARFATTRTSTDSISSG